MDAATIPSNPAARIHACALVFLATGCGLLWGLPNAPMMIALSLLTPMLWSRSTSRLAAGAVLAAYFLAASRGLPFGANIFFDQSAPSLHGWMLWLGAGLLNALPWAVCWHPAVRVRACMAPLLLVVSIIPPLGIIHWASPLTAAGWLFPGWGFAGLLLTLACVTVSILNHRRAAQVLAMLSALATITFALHTPDSHAFFGIDTSHGRLATASSNYIDAYRRIQEVRAIAHAAPPGSVTVLPETVIGRYADAARHALADTSLLLKDKGATVLVGAEVPTTVPGQFKNALVALGKEEGAELVQRIPVPIGMWRPWTEETAVANPFGSGSATIHGNRIAFLICYEQLLVLPVLLSMADGAELMIGAANDWWARTTSIPAIQQSAMRAWGRLFGVPVVTATNI